MKRKLLIALIAVTASLAAVSYGAFRLQQNDDSDEVDGMRASAERPTPSATRAPAVFKKQRAIEDIEIISHADEVPPKSVV